MNTGFTEHAARQGICFFLLLIAAFLFLDGTAHAKTRKTARLDGYNPLYASLVIDSETGQILSQSNPDKVLYPASLTKIMTLMLAFEAIENGRLDMNSRITISNHASAMPPSKLGLRPGQSIRVEDAVYAIVTKSANDMAAALAEKVGGSESAFVRMMNARALQLGMRSTHFVNASGLHNDNQTTSARDMATLARYMITQHPHYYRYFSKISFSYDGRVYKNHNHLMETYSGMDGMKTGYVRQSGFNLVASAVRGRHRLIGVVLGGRSTQTRNAEMARLLDAGFVAAQRLPALQVATARAPGNAPDDVLRPLRQADVAGAPVETGVSNAPGSEDDADGERVIVAALASGGARQSQLVGEGDFDPAVSKNIKTGLIRVHPQKPVLRPHIASSSSNPAARPAAAVVPVSLIQPAALPVAAATRMAVPVIPAAVPPGEKNWAIQVGAFTSRAASDQRLHDTVQKLPASYAAASPSIAPLKTGGGWIFRARLNGFTRAEADKACQYLSECLIVASSR